MIYISMQNENNEFVFRNSKVEEIKPEDVPIEEKIYLKYLQEEINKKFKIKNINGKTFEEIFEEVIPEPQEPGVIEPSPIEKLQAENAELKQSVAELSAIVTSVIAPN